MTLLRPLLAFAVTIGLMAGPARAHEALGSGIGTGGGLDRGAAATERPLLLAAGDCSGAASRAARQTGGQVLSVSTQTQGGQTVCVVTVLVPGKGDQRPRKQTVTIRP
ncbi:hypothetical protein [Jiella sonneratiae]|uniref:Secreted protein n=1 Tax=Jiella sonneratiae TaxID=2816856 RepID=A0ABS3J5I1_9HYPH|nr:hypothetical protein [Jiella sonneratiae]MBO0904929.1 hypothetical protein [Jiella sonneratiae]